MIYEYIYIYIYIYRPGYRARGRQAGTTTPHGGPGAPGAPASRPPGPAHDSAWGLRGPRTLPRAVRRAQRVSQDGPREPPDVDLSPPAAQDVPITVQEAA